MISKLLSLVGTAKGAAAATVIAAAGLTTGVVATNQDAQTAVTNVVETITNSAKSSNQPAVVASRNDADKKLRDAFQVDQQRSRSSTARGSTLPTAASSTTRSRPPTTRFARVSPRRSTTCPS